MWFEKYKGILDQVDKVKKDDHMKDWKENLKRDIRKYCE